MRDGHKEDRGVIEDDLEQLKTAVAAQGRRIRATETAVAATAVVGLLQSALQIAAPNDVRESRKSLDGNHRATVS